MMDSERTGDVEKDKKKRRRSNRRSKQNLQASVSVNESPIESSEMAMIGSTSYGHQFPRVSDVDFNSFLEMHIVEQAASPEGRSVENQKILPPDLSQRMTPNSCPETVAWGNSTMQFTSNESPLSHQFRYRKKYYQPHWSREAVDDALGKGWVFKATFRVNAHNKLEAYCKIDGVQVDILINGIAAQNRAVEGDIVVIEIDPLSLWTKMKGAGLAVHNSGSLDYCEVTELGADKCKEKNDADEGLQYVDSENCSPAIDSSIPCMDGSSSYAQVNAEVPGHSPSVSNRSYNHTNGHCSPAQHLSQAGRCSDLNEISLSVEKLCSIVKLYPAKRPTGRVVAIIERSPRRNTIVGFLSVKQWLYNRENYRRDNQKKTNSLSHLNQEYIIMTPKDPKFPKLRLFVRDLPDIIKRRLEQCDLEIETELVAAQINNWGEEDFMPCAHIIHTFGRGGEIDSQIDAILYENAVRSCDFSPESLSCLPSLSWEIPPGEFKSRRDLRNLCIFTIDPSTATDLDDALSVQRLPNGVYRVGVHIADVSYFVPPDTALDAEAQLRSTSFYLLRGKIPMLPPLLSENIGSLNPGGDKLAFSMFWDISPTGELLDQWIGRTIIRSCCKLSYEHAQDIIDGILNVGATSTLGSGLPQLHGHFGWSDVITCVRSLHEVSLMLKDKRFNDGALRLENSKVVFLFDDAGIPYDSVLSERKDSNFLVEEFMLLANRTAAEVISRAYPDCALLRRHPEPNLRKLKEFETFCKKHGIELDASSSGQLHHSLEQIRENLKDDSVFLNILVSYATRPMQLASYFCTGGCKDNESEWGHYALAVPFYTHFTSPLRRYPDIIVHRTLAATIEAEEIYSKYKIPSQNLNRGLERMKRCFTGIHFDKAAADSIEGQKALSTAASKYKIPCTEVVTDISDHCNERKLASRQVKDASDKLYMWYFLKNKEILLTEARVLALGPRFMTVYVQKLAIERRIHYDEVDDLMVEWLDTTSTLLLSLSVYKRFQRRSSPGRYRMLEDVALVASPLQFTLDFPEDSAHEDAAEANMESTISSSSTADDANIEPAVFPLTVRLLSVIPIALHATGGDDGPLDIGARLYVSSYLR